MAAPRVWLRVLFRLSEHWVPRAPLSPRPSRPSRLHYPRRSTACARGNGPCLRPAAAAAAVAVALAALPYLMDCSLPHRALRAEHLTFASRCPFPLMSAIDRAHAGSVGPIRWLEQRGGGPNRTPLPSVFDRGGAEVGCWRVGSGGLRKWGGDANDCGTVLMLTLEASAVLEENGSVCVCVRKAGGEGTTSD